MSFNKPLFYIIEQNVHVNWILFLTAFHPVTNCYFEPWLILVNCKRMKNIQQLKIGVDFTMVTPAKIAD